MHNEVLGYAETLPQEGPRIKAIAKEKSQFSRKSIHFQFKRDFGTTSTLARCKLI